MSTSGRVSEAEWGSDVIVETLRESDGLARSSRNVYLDEAQRAVAPLLYRSLCAGRDAYRAGERDAAALLAKARSLLGTEPTIQVDYLELRADGDLAPLPDGPVSGGRLLIAARLGTTRLIDNLSLSD